MFNSLFIASASEVKAGTTFKASGREATADKNGLMPIALSPLGGKYPSKGTVISGTVAKNAGIEAGHAYLLNCKETEPDPTYGRRFNISVVKEINALEIVQATAFMGEAQRVDVDVYTPVQQESLEAAAKRELANG